MSPAALEERYAVSRSGIRAGDARLSPNIAKRLIVEFSRTAGAARAPLRERVGDLTTRAGGGARYEATRRTSSPTVRRRRARAVPGEHIPWR
ncbi:hypothetical protein ACWEIM_04110 [Streptomyces sp. NPDC004778]